MGFSREAGYIPTDFATTMSTFRNEINVQFGTSYTEETFVGTNHYKYFYAIAQLVQTDEIKTSEIFLYLQQYFKITNEKISRPVTTAPGVVEKLESEGFIASAKPITETDAGKIFICVDLDDAADDYADQKIDVNAILKNSTVLGAVTQGTEVSNFVLTNGQIFPYKFNLPDRIPILLRLTITLSENNQSVILSPEEIKEILIANLDSRYRLGKNFEPMRYFSLTDAPWASQVLLEYSTNIMSPSWQSTVFDADYDELFEYSLENITLVES